MCFVSVVDTGPCFMSLIQWNNTYTMSGYYWDRKDRDSGESFMNEARFTFIHLLGCVFSLNLQNINELY